MAKGQSRPTNTGRPGAILVLLLVLIALLAGGVALSARGSGNGWVPKRALDLEGGSSITLTPKSTDKSAGKVTDANLQTAISILNKRVNARGVSEAEINSEGSGNGRTIVVSLPGRQDKALLQSLLTTAELRFRRVLTVAAGTPEPPPTAAPTPGATGSATTGATAVPSVRATSAPAATLKAPASATPSATSQGRVVPEGLAALPTAPTVPSPAATATPPPPAAPAIPGVTPQLQAKFEAYRCDIDNPVQADKPKEPLVTCDQDGTAKYLLDRADVLGADIKSASASLETNSQGIATTNNWQINLEFNGKGRKAWADLTKRVTGQTAPTDQVAVVLDGVVVVSPTIQEAIPNGQAQITGQFNRKEATEVAQDLKFGALPLTFDQGPLESISPTLGSDQLHGGLIAGAIGIGLVVLYVMVYYRGLGLIAVASLLVSALTTYLIVVLFSNQIGLRLSLASIAGLIVAIGITADSFVVYFERLRDEVREGRTLRVAVETGWRRARRTILVADFVSFLAAVVLYFLSVGGVQGFAFTLGLTTVVDVFVVFLFTKPLITLVAGSRFYGGGHRFSGLDARRLGSKPRAPRGVGSGTSLTKEA